MPPDGRSPAEGIPAARTRALRIVLADDERLYRDGLAALLERAGHEITAQVGEAAGLRAAVARTRSDLAVVDIRMPPRQRVEGLEAAVEIRRTHPGVGVLLLSKYVEMTHLQQLVRAGSTGFGYLLKERVAGTEFLDEVQRIAAGDFVLDREVQRALLGGRRKREGLARLSDREQEVLRQMARGLTNPAIARELGITVRTVEDHVRKIFHKLGLPDGADSDYHRRVLAVLRYLQSD